MLWLIPAVLCALFFTTQHLTGKYFGKDCKREYLTLYVFFLALLITTPIIITLWDELVFTTNSIITLILIGIISPISYKFYLESLSTGKIAKTVPILSTTPIFTTIIALILIREFPPLIGIFGILLVVIGAYTINLDKYSKKDFFAPLKAIIKEKPSRLMVYVTLLWGIGSTLDKYMIINSNLISRILLIYYPIFLFYLVYLIMRDKANFVSEVKKIAKPKFIGALIMAIAAFLTVIPQMTALTMTYAAYVIAVKRTAAIFSVIAAYFIFKEKRHFWTNLLGTVLLVGGVVLLVI